MTQISIKCLAPTQRLIDDLHLAISPVVLGEGEHLFGGLDLRALGYACTKHMAGGRAAAHVILQKQGLDEGGQTL